MCYFLTIDIRAWLLLLFIVIKYIEGIKFEWEQWLQMKER